jgi:hypothetical protein
VRVEAFYFQHFKFNKWAYKKTSNYILREKAQYKFLMVVPTNLLESHFYRELRSEYAELALVPLDWMIVRTLTATYMFEIKSNFLLKLFSAHKFLSMGNAKSCLILNSNPI